ncbi:Cilia- and flagella-associated protein 100 [Coelomomyces lativittatus]|nr:Cilia- and flagella-associated protein 100 [Coelomomyces lativittatus]KAJ1516328.1 Cilia- and flagella-associated protein 100 [Coelomomyces lativittatus]
MNSGGDEEEKNPFCMPSDSQVFSFFEKENNRKKNNSKNLDLKKTKLYDTKRSHRRTFKQLLQEEQNVSDQSFDKQKAKKDGDKLIISQQSKDRNMGKENLHDFVVKKREMFLLQYALGVKKDEIKKLEQIAQAEEQKLLDDERSLEEDAAKFDAFLKENDKNSVEAIKRAEAETKAKLEKMSEIKKLNNQILQIRSEMSKNEDQLKDYQRYRQFLEKLTPIEWLKQHQKQKPTKPKNAQEDNSKKEKTTKKEKHVGGNKVLFGKKPIEEEESTAVEVHSEDDLHAEEESIMPLYFTDPQQLLDLFAELEESNLDLIQNCQETEETLEELRVTIQETEIRMAKETEILRTQIEFLNLAIAKEEEKAKQFEERARLFTSSLSEADQEKILSELNQKVKEVYRKCLGDADTNISTLQMLTSIENRLEQLFETIELMPAEKVEKAERLKDKERRHRLREEKMDAQRILQEERIQRALERARAPVKKKTGKPLVFRSAPPQRKKKRAQNTKNKEEGNS